MAFGKKNKPPKTGKIEEAVKKVERTPEALKEMGISTFGAKPPASMPPAETGESPTLVPPPEPVLTDAELVKQIEKTMTGHRIITRLYLDRPMMMQGISNLGSCVNHDPKKGVYVFEDEEEGVLVTAHGFTQRIYPAMILQVNYEKVIMPSDVIPTSLARLLLDLIGEVKNKK